MDLLWPTERVVMEFDGWAAHGHLAAFERGHRRGQVLNAAGYTVFRVTWRQLTEEPVAWRSGSLRPWPAPDGRMQSAGAGMLQGGCDIRMPRFRSWSRRRSLPC